jgi:hypothetical protein
VAIFHHRPIEPPLRGAPTATTFLLFWATPNLTILRLRLWDLIGATLSHGSHCCRETPPPWPSSTTTPLSHPSGEPPPPPPCQAFRRCLPGTHITFPGTPCLPVSLGRPCHRGSAARGDHMGECVGCAVQVGPQSRRPWACRGPALCGCFLIFPFLLIILENHINFKNV